MGTIIKIRELINELEPLRKSKTIGLVTGRFDLIHTGYISFLRFAKSQVDILIVGVDEDTSIKKTFFNRGPIHTQQDRLKVLSEFSSVDYVIPLENIYSYTTKESAAYYKKITKAIKPNYLISSKQNDLYWQSKKDRIESLGGELLLSDHENEDPLSSRVLNLVFN